MRGRILIPLALLAAAGSVIEMRADLGPIRAEKNLFRRARRAVENADRMMDTARDAYQKGQRKAMMNALKELDDSLALAYESLKETGRKPRKISNHYKRAEIGSRKLLRRLEDFRDEMSYTDRAPIDEVIKKVQKIHDQLLRDVMGGGK